MGKYQPYPEYKSSDVEFIGNLPITWSLSKLKHMFSIINGSTPKSGVSAYWDGDITWVTPADLSKLPTFQIWSSARSITQEGLNSCGTTIVPSGSLVLSSRAPIGSLAVTAVPLCTNQGCKSLIPKNKIHIKYIYYYLIAMKEQLNLFGRGTTFLELSTDDLGNFPIPSLPHSEWENIANFLDHETAKIDALIEKQQQLISLLQEKRQAVISHAVSIKSGEKSAKLSYFIDLLSGFAFPSSGFKQEPNNAIPLLRGINVGVDHIKWSENVYWPSSDVPKLKEFELAEGDIVFGMDRPWISSGARVAEIKNSDLPCLLLQRVARIRSLEGTYQPFVKLCLSSHEFKRFIEADLTGVSVPHISPDQIKSFPIRAIGFEKQKHLTDLALAQCKKLNEIENQAKKAIDLMQERRTALISAAVTGKIDVRNWEVPSQSSTTNTEEQAL
ncbi:MAG: restriction endonuclease subunit S [Shewanella sp.]